MKVNGIGGVFIYADDPSSLAAWYSQHLGIEFTADDAPSLYFRVFYYRDVDDPAKRLNTTFAILPAKARLGPKRGEAMINYL